MKLLAIWQEWTETCRTCHCSRRGSSGSRGARALSFTAEALGREWERLLGDPRYARITRIDAQTQTAYGEITGRCPLRGTGDLDACERLMAYDRKLLAPRGGTFVVLASQAELRNVRCEVGIRPQLLSAADLVPAHARRRGRLR